MLLIIATFMDAIKPEVKPLLLVVHVGILSLGCIWFGKLALMKRADRKSPPPGAGTPRGGQG